MFTRPSQITEDKKNEILDRMWQKDASLWTSEPEAEKEIISNLDCLDPISNMELAAGKIVQFIEELKAKGIKQCIFLTSEGTGVCPSALNNIFRPKEGSLTLKFVNGLDEKAIQGLTKDISLSETFFILSGKKEIPLNTQALFHYFWSLCEKDGLKPKDNFAAISDDSGKLHELAIDRQFSQVFLNPGNISPKLSALFYPALFTIAAGGHDVHLFIDRMKDMTKQCSADYSWEKNPACLLADFLSEYGVQNRDKLTLLADPAIKPFTLWIEQIMASFTGKETGGILPITGETTGIPGFYGGERMFVYLRYSKTPEKDSLNDFIEELRKADFPIYEICLDDLYDISGQLFLWTFAALLTSHFVGVNPFGEKEAAATYEKTQEILNAYKKTKEFPAEFWIDPQSHINFRASKMLAPSIKSLSRAIKDIFTAVPTWGYIAFLSYLPEDDEVLETFGTMRHLARQEKGCAITYGHGPGYLNSTGQLHKAGPISSAFLIFTRRQGEENVEVPEMGLNFWQINFAIASGDFEALSEVNRRVIHVHLSRNHIEGLKSFSKVFSRAVRI